MLIQITIDTAQPSPTEQRVLDALSDRVASSTITVVHPSSSTSVGSVVAGPLSSTSGGTITVTEPEPVEDAAPTLDDAVARATTMVSAGKTAEVKAALATAGAKRVSELKPANIQTFLDALDG